jgi:hypothetical protein
MKYGFEKNCMVIKMFSSLLKLILDCLVLMFRLQRLYNVK